MAERKDHNIMRVIPGLSGQAHGNHKLLQIPMVVSDFLEVNISAHTHTHSMS